jgi:hypothetical protein
MWSDKPPHLHHSQWSFINREGEKGKEYQNSVTGISPISETGISDSSAIGPILEIQVAERFKIVKKPASFFAFIRSIEPAGMAAADFV